MPITTFYDRTTARIALVVGSLTLVALVACGESTESTGGDPTDAGALNLDASAPDAGPGEPAAKSCSAANGGCAAEATCDETTGAVRCTCKPGFSGDGGTCANVAGSLSGLRWELPCLADVTDPALCTTQTQNITKQASVAGAPGTTYSVKLRFRGVIEPKTYNGGAETGFFSVGGTPAIDTANIYRLTVSAPAATFFVNSGMTRSPAALYAEAIDYEATVDMAAGATVILTAEPLDSLQIKNRNQGGVPFVISDVPPAPAPYAGQFVQMDVLSVVEK